MRQEIRPHHLIIPRPLVLRVCRSQHSYNSFSTSYKFSEREVLVRLVEIVPVSADQKINHVVFG